MRLKVGSEYVLPKIITLTPTQYKDHSTTRHIKVSLWSKSNGGRHWLENFPATLKIQPRRCVLDKSRPPIYFWRVRGFYWSNRSPVAKNYLSQAILDLRKKYPNHVRLQKNIFLFDVQKPNASKLFNVLKKRWFTF